MRHKATDRGIKPSSPACPGTPLCSLRLCDGWDGRGISRKEEEEKEKDVKAAGQSIFPHGAEQDVASRAEKQITQPGSVPLVLHLCSLT